MKTKSLKTSILLALIACLLVVSAVAALSGPSIPWDVVSGGGGTAAGGNITISDTIGQPIVGHSSGGNLTVDAGYWVPLAASAITFSIFLPVITR